MSLGVLNNISAIYAENNLNSSNNSLNTVLQQLSSGSKINSGADDAAGLSLVSGLEANQTALTQSQTNASEGVALLKVADGALAQVTSLLNRAVTLATEASNGSLNATQDTAANQEYQSILDEVNNIGTTTSYNQQQVFNSNTAIYTGDSSTVGASLNDLNIRSLSSANLGDTGGTMGYSSTSANGGDDVFLDLSAGGTQIAALNDGLMVASPGSPATITIDTLSSTGTLVTHTVSTGDSSTTGYADTVGGLINAINSAGLGVTASFATGNAAGVAAAGADTGIMITGAVGVGTAPSTNSFSGTLAITGAHATTDALTGSITIQDGTGAAQTISMAQVVGSTENQSSGSFNSANLQGLVNYINDYSPTANNTTGTYVYGVKAAIGADGSLTLTSVNTAGTTQTGNALSVSETLNDASAAVQPLTYTATAAYSVGVSKGTAFDADSGQANATDVTLTAGKTSSTSGIATINYSDQGGVSLANTDLSTQGDAESTLTALNTAIADVAAQDGYIGAQINTLNAASSVLSTQQENISLAQNAVQATDYASAASNMSKYEILSQTGISALAQANSIQGEVTKLLQ